MIPFLCEITICLVVSYSVGLLMIQRESRVAERAKQSRSDARPASRREPAVQSYRRLCDLRHMLLHSPGVRPRPSRPSVIASKVTLR
jgi:hypothetical protein